MVGSLGLEGRKEVLKGREGKERVRGCGRVGNGRVEICFLKFVTRDLFLFFFVLFMWLAVEIIALVECTDMY